MHLIDEVMTVPQSSCSVIKHAHAILLVHAAVLVAFVLGVYVSFSSMFSVDDTIGCDVPLFNFSLLTKVGLAFVWGVMMNVVSPVA